MSYTINPNAKNKWARNAENTMDLSLETDASSVYLDNGRTLEQEIGEGSMVSNMATVDTSMSKVIDGTLDGAYESLVFKGKSLVNLGREINSQYHNIAGEGTQITSDGYFKIPYAGSENSHFVRLKFGLLEPLIKPDTVYSLIVEIAENTTQNARIGFTEHNNLSCVQPVDRNTNIASAVGTHVKLIKRRSEVTARQSDLYFCIWDKTNVDATKHIKFRYMILEGDWTNKELPPFFTGIGYAKMPILRNVGKNLLTREYTLNAATLVEETNEYVITKGSGNIGGGLVFTPNLIPNKTYSFSVTAKTNRIADGAIRVYNDTRKEYISVYLVGLTTQTQKVGGVFTVPSTHQMGDEFKIWIGKNTDYDLETTFTIYKDWQLEESSSITTYEDYKSNILRTSEEIVLREVGGVCDTYNPLTGEYVQRIGEAIFNGSENWWETSIAGQTIKRFRVNFISKRNNSNQTLICDRVLSVPNSEWNVDREQIEADGKILSIRKTFNTVEDFKTWLSQNPLTVQYILAESITTIIEPLTTPFAYENGHIILESGYEGQSLLPTLEYSTVVNKTGLVENVAKTIQRQEKQLTMLEKMLIQNIINLDYNNTLLTLKNEMEEML